MLHRDQQPPLVDLQQRKHGAFVDAARILQAAGNRVDQRAVRDWLAEWRRLAVLPIRVHLVEVAGQAREVDDVRRGHRARGCAKFAPKLEILEKQAASHWFHADPL